MAAGIETKIGEPVFFNFHRAIFNREYASRQPVPFADRHETIKSSTETEKTSADSFEMRSSEKTTAERTHATFVSVEAKGAAFPRFVS